MRTTLHFALVSLTWLMLSILCFKSTYGLKPMQTWELEDYNDWNIPFAKTVEIKGLKGTANYTADYPNNYPHNLAANSYTMEVDPSALFTVLFLDKSYFQDYTDDQLINLNYTFLGNT